MQTESEIRDPLIIGKKTYHDISKEISYPVEGKANKYWWILFGLSRGCSPRDIARTVYTHQSCNVGLIICHHIYSS